VRLVYHGQEVGGATFLTCLRRQVYPAIK